MGLFDDIVSGIKRLDPEDALTAVDPFVGGGHLLRKALGVGGRKRRRGAQILKDNPSLAGIPLGLEPGLSSSKKGRGGAGSVEDILNNLLGGGAGGGGGFRPQTAEEAASLMAQAALARARAKGLPGLTRAQTALNRAQAKDIPKRTELSRRELLANVGATQAELAANPRRVFESLFFQARTKPTELAKSLQERLNIPGFRHGGEAEGPEVAMVGKDDDEYALLAPGSVVAPMKKGDKATMHDALTRIAEQVDKDTPEHMDRGGSISPEKARKILEDGEVNGEPLTEKQRGFFGLIASGKKPRKAQQGLSLLGLPPEVRKMFEQIREGATRTVLEGTRAATGGTSLFDPVGGSTFSDTQKEFLRGLGPQQARKLSPTQRGALSAALSANRVAPEDFFERIARDLEGVNPVARGTSARFSGILGR